MPWEVTDQYIRSGHKTPGETCRTITISANRGIKAIYCKYGDKWAIQSYLFSKAKGWTLSKAKAWFSSHKESVERHVDFQRIFRNFLKFFGDNGQNMYKDFLSQNMLDETKPYTPESQLRESFEWVEPNLKYWKKVKDAKYYKGFLLSANVSMNENDYSTHEDFVHAAENLGWRPLDIDHNGRWILPYPENRLEQGKIGENNIIEMAIRIANDAKIPNTGDEDEGRSVQEMIESGEIVHPSIFAIPICGVHMEDERNVPTCGYDIHRVALLRKRTKLPGDPLSKIFPLPLNEALSSSMVESLQTHNNGESTKELKEYKPPRGEKLKMTKEKTEEQFADLPDSNFACIVGEGDNKIRKLPIQDAAHTRNAMARFNQAEGCQSAEVKAKICRAARKFNIENAFEKGGFCSSEESVEDLEEAAKLKEKISELTDELLETRKDLLKARETNSQKDQLVDRMAKKASGFEKKLAKVEPEKAELTEALEKARKQLSREEGDHSKTKGELAETKETNAHLTKEVELKDRQLLKVEERNGKLDAQLSEARQKANDESAKRATAVEKAIAETRERAQYQQDNADLREEVADLTKEVSNLSQKRVDDAKKIYKLQEEINKNKGRDEATNEEIKKLRRLNRIQTKTLEKLGYKLKE